MFVAINRLKVPAEYGSHLEERFQVNAGGMADVAGFVSFELMRAEQGGEYLVVTHWEDKGSFQAWRDGDAFSRAHSGTNPNSPVTSELGTYDIVISR